MDLRRRHMELPHGLVVVIPYISTIRKIFCFHISHILIYILNVAHFISLSFHFHFIFISFSFHFHFIFISFSFHFHFIFISFSFHFHFIFISFSFHFHFIFISFSFHFHFIFISFSFHFISLLSYWLASGSGMHGTK